jgi:Flp pilus assembly pilin Flp
VQLSNASQPTSKEKETVKNFILNFVKDEQGQDLIEYTLLMAFIALASAAIFVNAGGSVNQIWGSASSQLVNAANNAAS